MKKGALCALGVLTFIGIGGYAAIKIQDSKENKEYENHFSKNLRQIFQKMRNISHPLFHHKHILTRKTFTNQKNTHNIINQNNEISLSEDISNTKKPFHQNHLKRIIKYCKRLSFFSSLKQKPDDYHPINLYIQNINDQLPLNCLSPFPKNKLRNFHENNEIELYFDGPTAFESMWNDINNSKRSIKLVTYTFENDEIGQKTFEYLKKACERGVNVTVLIDHFGSFNILHMKKTKLYKEFQHYIQHKPKNKNLHIYIYNKIKPAQLFYPRIFHRLHAKFIIVDNQIAHMGGMNIGNGYAWKRKEKEHNYYDHHLRILGPCIDEFNILFYKLIQQQPHELKNSLPYIQDNLSFLRHLRSISIHSTFYLKKNNSSSQHVHDASLRLFYRYGYKHDKKHHFDTLNPLFKACFLQCKHKVDVINPLICMPLAQRKIINDALKKGIEIRFITAGRNNDVLFSHPAHRYLYYQFHKEIQIYEYCKSILHSKSMIIDDQYAIIGSSNLDRYSLLHNTEIAALIYSPSLVELTLSISNINIEITFS